MDLERISLAIDKDLIGRFDTLVARARRGNRSEAVRDLIRRRLVEAGHEHHHEVLATMHVHLDHDLCLEVMALRGKPADLRRLAAFMIGLKGVKHGQLVMSSANI